MSVYDDLIERSPVLGEREAWYPFVNAPLRGRILPQVGQQVDAPAVNGGGVESVPGVADSGVKSVSGEDLPGGGAVIAGRGRNIYGQTDDQKKILDSHEVKIDAKGSLSDKNNVLGERETDAKVSDAEDNPYAGIGARVAAGTPFYDAFVEQFGGSRRAVDEKKAKRNKTLASVADMAMLLGDMVGGYSGGNVVRRNGSVAANYEGDLQKYRDYYDRINRDIDARGYQARVADIREGLRKGERLEDMIARARRWQIEDERYKENMDFRKKEAERQQKNWEDKIDLEEKKLNELKKKNASDKEIKEQELRIKGLKADIQKANKTYTLVGEKGRYVIPKNDEGIIGYLFNVIRNEAQKNYGQNGAIDLNGLMIAMGDADARSKQRAIVETYLKNYPVAEEYLIDYIKREYPDLVDSIDMPDWKDDSKQGLSNQIEW